jgi:hypothetical protein
MPESGRSMRSRSLSSAIRARPGRDVYLGQMTVLIDPPRWPAHGRLWAHLASDASYQELHDFAERNGIPQRGFDHDHYDVPADRYDELVEGGATPVDSRELLRRIGSAGLRQPKRDRRER